MARSLLAIGLAAAVLATPAVASDYYDRNVRTDVVSVGDLDLTSGWGMDRLIKRLRGRIDAMCDWDEQCRDEAWLSADWQVAREVKRDQWRKRIAYERAQDRRYYRRRRVGPPPMVRESPRPAEPPRIAYAPPPGAVPVAKTVTTTTQTFTVKTTTVTLTYRLPPPDYRATWTPRCDCGR